MIYPYLYIIVWFIRVYICTCKIYTFKLCQYTYDDMMYLRIHACIHDIHIYIMYMNNDVIFTCIHTYIHIIYMHIMKLHINGCVCFCVLEDDQQGNELFRKGNWMPVWLSYTHLYVSNVTKKTHWKQHRSFLRPIQAPNDVFVCLCVCASVCLCLGVCVCVSHVCVCFCSCLHLSLSHTSSLAVFLCTWMCNREASCIGTATWCTYTLQHTATHCNTLQHTATHCNTLHHTATGKRAV